MDSASQPDLRAVISARVLDLRAAQRLTQQDVAARAEVAVKTISNIESGRILPNRKTRSAVARALGITLEDLEAVAS